MDENKLRVALAVLHYKDGRYRGGRKPIAFTYERDFRQFVRYNREILFQDGVLVILLGGDHITTTLDELRRMEWTL